MCELLTSDSGGCFLRSMKEEASNIRNVAELLMKLSCLPVIKCFSYMMSLLTQSCEHQRLTYNDSCDVVKIVFRTIRTLPISVIWLYFRTVRTLQISVVWLYFRTIRTLRIPVVWLYFRIVRTLQISVVWFQLWYASTAYSGACLE